MSISRERFEQGMSYESYKAQMTSNRDRLEEEERTILLPDHDVRFFRELPEALDVLVLTEDWCEPAITFIPVLAHLAKASQRLHLRIFLRDQHPDIMEQYLKDAVHPSIPTFVFFDEAFREVGRWHERPARIASMFADMMSALFATDPLFSDIESGTPIPQLPPAAKERAIQQIVRFGAETKELAAVEFTREIRELIEAHFSSYPST